MTQYHIAPHKPTIVRIGDDTPPAYAALGGDTPENLRDHAEYIVKACNNHAKLVDALECMIIGAQAVAVPHPKEREVLQAAYNIAAKALHQLKENDND
jgi:hypothetical protein